MRRVRYAVAASLDGYIAGPKGEVDWIIMNPEIDFRAVFEQFDTFLIGRRTFEMMSRAGRGETPGMKTFVFSRTLRQQDYPGVTVVAEKSEETVVDLRAPPRGHLNSDEMDFLGMSPLAIPSMLNKTRERFVAISCVVLALVGVTTV